MVSQRISDGRTCKKLRPGEIVVDFEEFLVHYMIL